MRGISAHISSHSSSSLLLSTPRDLVFGVLPPPQPVHTLLVARLNMAHATPPTTTVLCDDVLVDIFEIIADDYTNLGRLLLDSESMQAAGYVTTRRFLSASQDLIAAQAAFYRLALVSRQFRAYVQRFFYRDITLYNRKQHEMLLATLVQDCHLVDRIKTLAVVELLGDRKAWPRDRKKKWSHPETSSFLKQLSGKFSDDKVSMLQNLWGRVRHANYDQVYTWDHDHPALRDQALNLFAILLLCPGLKVLTYAPTNPVFNDIFDVLICTWEANIPVNQVEFKFLNTVEKLTLHSPSCIVPLPSRLSFPRLQTLVLIDVLVNILFQPQAVIHMARSIRELRISNVNNLPDSINDLITAVERLESLTYDATPIIFSSPGDAHFHFAAPGPIQLHAHCLRYLKVTISTINEACINLPGWRTDDVSFKGFPHLSHLEVPSMLLPCDSPSLVDMLPPNIEDLTILFWFDQSPARHMLTMAVEQMPAEIEHYPALRNVTTRELRKSTLPLDLPVRRIARDFADRGVSFKHECVE